MKILLLLLLILSFNSVFGQKQSSNLEQKIEHTDSLFKAGEIETSINLISEIIRKIESNPDENERAEYYVKVGKFFSSNQIAFKAIEYFNIVINMFHEPNTHKADALNEMAEVHFKDGNYEKAYYYWDRAFEISKPLNYSIGLADAYNGFGIKAGRNGDPETELEYYKLSLKYSEQFNNYKDLYSIHHNIAGHYINRSNYDAYETHMNKSYDYVYKLEDTLGPLVDLELLKCHYYRSLKEYDSAKIIAFNGLSFLGDKKLQYPRQYQYLVNELLICSKYKNELDSAVYYLYEFIKIKGTLNRKNTETEIAQTEAKNLILNKEKEVKTIKEKAIIQRKNDRLENRFWVLSFIVAFITGGLLVVILRIRNQSLRRKNQLIEDEKKIRDLEIKSRITEQERQEIENRSLQEKIDHKNKELSMATLHLISKNETLNSIQNKFSDIPEKTIELVQLNNEIKASLDLDKDWNLFKFHFENVHEKFFESLQNQFPNLTPEEYRLCAYLRINLSSKEIAQILSIQPTAVHKRRNRIRSKFELERNDSLLDFLSQI